MLIDFKSLIQKYNLNITGVIQVGAHYGEEVKDYIHIVDKAVLFEPLADNIKVLKNNVHNYLKYQKIKIGFCPEIIVHMVALGDKTDQQVSMYLSSNELQSSSILEPYLHLTGHPNVHFTGQEKVDIKRLNEYEEDCAGCNLLMMDTQGYELEVLKGGSNILGHIDYVYCEVSRGELYKNTALVEDIDAFLKNYGFYRAETCWATDLWGDALYLKGEV
jgi:FkbM family methyltransferase